MVVSSLAAAGPLVLEDLETPYSILQGRRRRERDRRDMVAMEKAARQDKRTKKR